MRTAKQAGWLCLIWLGLAVRGAVIGDWTLLAWAMFALGVNSAIALGDKT